jgi:serine/threonine protein kinase
VILCERGGLADVAKVVDFGLVKDLDAADALSHEGMLVGTPLYLAPEAIRSAGADPRSDLYSVGAVAYFLLTGQHVFDGRTVIEICGNHLHTPPEPPSLRLGRPVPAELVDPASTPTPRRPLASASRERSRQRRGVDCAPWSPSPMALASSPVRAAWTG